MPDYSLFGDEHVRKYEATGGKVGHDWNGTHCLILHTTGRKSGETRKLPLIYGRDGNDYVLVASKGGAPQNPGWYRNLVAHPDAKIQVWDKVIPVRALSNVGTRRFTETQLEVIGRYRRGELTYEEASLAIEHYWAGALRRAVVEGDVENGSLMAGHSVCMVKKIQPVRDILAELVEQAEQALARREGSLQPTAAEA